MRELGGFHTLWTAPYFARGGADSFRLEDYELLTMVLSAIMWRKKNGPIALYGDDRAIDYLDKQGLLHIWNGGVKNVDVPRDINPAVFWAAGKLYALQRVKAPAVMVDMDLIVWKDVRDYVAGTDICAIHREGINLEVYPDKDFFRMKEGYTFNERWSWNELPVNTCMLYLANDEFKRYYTDSATEFMESCAETSDNLCHMVFAEQRLLAMCATAEGKAISSFFPGAQDIDRQDIFTHLWGYKNILKFNYAKREEFNRQLAARIIREAPEVGLADFLADYI